MDFDFVFFYLKKCTDTVFQNFFLKSMFKILTKYNLEIQ